jgi:hypothetical protein
MAFGMETSVQSIDVLQDMLARMYCEFYMLSADSYSDVDPKFVVGGGGVAVCLLQPWSNRRAGSGRASTVCVCVSKVTKSNTCSALVLVWYWWLVSYRYWCWVGARERSRFQSCWSWFRVPYPSTTRVRCPFIKQKLSFLAFGAVGGVGGHRGC